MTWNSLPRGAAEVAARAADRPFLVGTHIGDGCRPRWTSATGAHTDADESAPGAPAILAVDRSGARETYPAGGPATEWWLSFGAVNPLVGIEGIDTLLMLSNLGTGDITCAIEVADDAAYATNLETVHAFVPTQPRRWVDHFDARWFGDSYIRLHLTSATPFLPRIRELWMGRSRQLRGYVRNGRDPLAIGSKMAGGEVEASTRPREQAIGRAVVPMSIRLLNDAASLQDGPSVRAWWDATDGGALPFVAHLRPVSAQHDARIMVTDATALDLPRASGPFDQVLEQPWRETPPFRATEV